MKRLLWLLAFAAMFAAAFAARCWNVADIFVEEEIYFVDADCYARMERAAMVADGRALVIRHHDFENFPSGTTPHTTGPVDWLIALGSKLLAAIFAVTGSNSVLRGQTLDLAGALLGPLLGGLTSVWLLWWGNETARRGSALAGWSAAVLFAVSPILVHGTALGRPDHQSLLILLMSVALGSEWRIAAILRENGRPERWGTLAGAAWGVGMWVSFYEPLVILALVGAAWLALDRRRILGHDFRGGWLLAGGIVLASVLVEGWRMSGAPGGFAAWAGTIGEMRHLHLSDGTILRWLGAGSVVAPLLLIAGARQDRSRLVLLAFLLALLALTVWQLRWGYFLALAFAMSLPWQLAAFRREWLAAIVLVISLWPVARDWDAILFPDEFTQRMHSEKRAEAVGLRQFSTLMRSSETAPFLAPWWLSPAIAYWSGQPGVAGSSHEALPGTMESARFFMAPDAAAAVAIAQRLGVKWIVTDGPDHDGISRLTKAYAPLVDGSVPAKPWGVLMHERGHARERVSAADLADAVPAVQERLLALTARAEAEELGSDRFTCVAQNPFSKLFRVVESPKPHE